MSEDFVNLGEVAEKDGFGFFELIGFDVIFEATIGIVYFASDGFRANVFGGEVRMLGDVFVEGVVDEVGAGFGVFDFFEFFHSLVVIEAFFFHFGDRFVFGTADLSANDLVRVFENGFDEGEDVEGVFGIFGVELRDGV